MTSFWRPELFPRIQVSGFSDEKLAAFRRHQRRAWDTLSAIAGSLGAGDTERIVARRIRKAFHEQGVHHYFHVPVALFGERTAYPGDFGDLDALPTDTELRPGMPVILDAAPIIDGHVVDVSLAQAFGDNPVHAELMTRLGPLRDRIAERARDGATFREISREIDQLIRSQDLENCHGKHIGAVLGHRVSYAPEHWLSRRRIWGLSVWHAGWFIGRSVSARLRGNDGSPNWNHGRDSDHPPTDGLWAVEPHIARDGVGVKFEEILVIQSGAVYWLDDALRDRAGRPE